MVNERCLNNLSMTTINLTLEGGIDFFSYWLLFARLNSHKGSSRDPGVIVVTCFPFMMLENF